MNVPKNYIKPMKQTISYTGKPDIYMRIEHEREKIKNVKAASVSNFLFIIYLCSRKIKYHPLRQ